MLLSHLFSSALSAQRAPGSTRSSATRRLVAVRQCPVREAARLTVHSTHHPASLQGEQCPVNLLGDHRSAPKLATVLGNRDAGRCGRHRPRGPREGVN